MAVLRPIRDTTVLVTGGAGFLGSHMVDYLITDRHCKVIVIDNLVVGRKEYVHPQALFLHADITQSETYLCSVMKRHKVQYVFNYAAYPYIPDSFARPLHIFNVNAVGALQVINAAQEAGCRGILQVSSAEIYGNGSHGNGGMIDEQTLVVPHSSYGSSKAAIDAMVQVRWREANTPCLSLRQFNCIGERDMLHPYVVPEIYRQIKAWKDKWPDGFRIGDKLQECNVRLGNNSTRDFLYAGDQAIMACELLENGAFGYVYNLGSQHTIHIYDLALLMGRIMGVPVVVEVDPARYRPWEIWHLQSDNNRIHGVIEHRPMITLEGALRRTIDYFDTHPHEWAW